MESPSRRHTCALVCCIGAGAVSSFPGLHGTEPRRWLRTDSGGVDSGGDGRTAYGRGRSGGDRTDEPPGLIKGGDGHDKAGGGRRAATAIERVPAGPRRDIPMLASSRPWFAALRAISRGLSPAATRGGCDEIQARLGGRGTPPSPPMCGCGLPTPRTAGTPGGRPTSRDPPTCAPRRFPLTTK